MTDVHVPHLREGAAAHAEPSQAHARWTRVLEIGVEVVLITVGVFLGLAGEHWRESVAHHGLALESLTRFRAEVVANRSEVARVHDRHARELRGMLSYLSSNQRALTGHEADPRQPMPLPLPDTVTDSAGLTYSAWDVALATQSLAYLDARLVGDLSAMYRLQQIYDDSHRAIQQSSYSISNEVEFLNGVTTYFGDATLYETLLQKDYDDILPRLDTAITAAK